MPEYTAHRPVHIAARREAMLDELLGAVRTRRRRRHALRASGSLGLLLVVAAVARLVPAGPGAPPFVHPSEPAAVENVARITTVRNDASIVDRLAAHTGATNVEFIDDLALISQLEPTCGPVGLARVGDQVRLYGGCPELHPPVATP